MTGSLPSYLIYVDQNSIRGKALREGKYLYVGILIFLACGTMAYPFFVIIMVVKKRYAS
jgi:hypothetical protein